MKKSSTHLLKLAEKFKFKYGQSQTLQQIIENAASYGEKSPNGIMNFPAQLRQDQANLSLSITISSGLMGGRNVEVSTPAVDPPQFSPRYAKLPEQIKKYLERHLKDFPQIPEETITLNFYGSQT